jgi:hypothetical protein
MTITIRLLLPTLATVLVLCGPALAARPLVTEDAPTVEQHKFEFALGADWEDRGGSNLDACAALKAGLNPRLDAGLALPCGMGPDREGLEQVEGTVKFLLLQPQPAAVTVAAYWSLDGAWHRETAVLTLALGGFVLHANGGPETIAGPEPSSFGTWAGAVEAPPLGPLTVVAEAYGHAGTEAGSSAAGGIRAAAAEGLALDAGGAARIRGSDPRYRATAGMTLTF